MSNVKQSKPGSKWDKKRHKIIREGQYNKERIFQFIAKNKNRKGVSIKQIQDYLKGLDSELSRPTIYSHLDELIMEKKVFQSREYGKYLLADWELADIHNFAQSMKDASEMMIKTPLIDRSPNDKVAGQNTISSPGSFYIEFSKALAGISVSKEFCDTRFDKNTLNEKYIFEFVNRVGAFITYLLIESMRPLADKKKQSIRTKPTTYFKARANRRNELSSTLLEKAIEIKTIFRCFYDLITSFSPRLGYTANVGNRFANTGDTAVYDELNRHDFDKLSDVFRSVYPGIYHALEKKWQYDNNYETDWLEYKEEHGLKCNHKWETTFLYKLGRYYFCLKCHNFVSDHFMKYLRKRKKSK